jgi:hypothetical protein
MPLPKPKSTSPNNPYAFLPRTAFWKNGVALDDPTNPAELYLKKWEITESMQIATAGSCFAQHITRELRDRSFRVIDFEPPPRSLAECYHSRFGFSMYSCRYGNIYTVHQLLQLLREAAGILSFSENAWERDGKFFDAFRPAVEPDGLDTVEEVVEHRKHHLRMVAEMIRSFNIFVFTLGLTEAWIHRSTGAIYPVAPGTICGNYDPDVYAFINFGFVEIMDAFQQVMELVSCLRPIGSNQPRYLITVSPVPLTATASGMHVLTATTYSKAILRSVAGTLADTHPNIDYFPSYEIITNQAARAQFYESNFRSVRMEGVKAVMNVFFSQHLPYSSGIDKIPVKPGFHSSVQCEEALTEAFLK